MIDSAEHEASEGEASLEDPAAVARAKPCLVSICLTRLQFEVALGGRVTLNLDSEEGDFAADQNAVAWVEVAAVEESMSRRLRIMMGTTTASVGVRAKSAGAPCACLR